MAGRITPGQIKENNRQQIYSYIYHRRKASQQDMLYALRLSRPTVASNLAALEEDGLICKSGQIETDQIGRKAVAYAIVTDYRVAVGVEILRARVKMIAVDLYGEKLSREVVELHFANETDYYRRVCGEINRFVDALPVPRERILGVGISAQALASRDGEALRALNEYLSSGLWLEDYEADERGELPPDLKRGVLSQDALYDLLTEEK